jgi:hypothetical protein
VKNTDHYVVEIYDGIDFAPANLVHTADIAGDLITYEYVLPAGDTQFSARIKAVSSTEGVADSKWISVGFKSDPENLFTGYVSEMTGLGTCTVKWAPGVAATAIVLDKGGVTSYPLTSGEITAGVKNLTGVASGKYEIRLMNSTFVRGRTNISLEGDAYLAAGGDLNAALNALPAGGILLLANGEKYGLTKPDTVALSIKVRGINATNRPIIYLNTGGGNHMFDIAPAMTLSDSLVFQYVDISCYYDDAGITRHRGVIDQELTAMNIGKIRFLDCIIRNSGRSAIRLRSGGTPVQYIETVEFNNCIMYDYAWDSHYGILNGAKGGNFGNIKFINTTVYNARGGTINYGNGAGCLSVVIDNCTFDRLTMDTSARYFIDFGTTGNTSAGTITISDCIFGQTSAIANGVRAGLMSLSVTGSYYTSDFINVAGSIATSMTAYAGSSSALWTNPATGIFTYMDANFPGLASAGAPRWRP